MDNQNIEKLDSITQQALKAINRSSCKDCPIGHFNCEEQYIKLCTFSFIKGYKAGRRHKYKKKNNYGK